MSATPLMPAAFLGHGSPMNALERNRFTEAWRSFGASVPRPRAILAVSAHWHVNGLAVTAMPNPRTIHDFYGFPQALFDVQYPAPGLPQLAQEVADAVSPDRVGFDVDGWGIGMLPSERYGFGGSISTSTTKPGLGGGGVNLNKSAAAGGKGGGGAAAVAGANGGEGRVGIEVLG